MNHRKSSCRLGVLAAGLLWLAASNPVHAQGTIRYVPNFDLPLTPLDYSRPVDLDGNGTTDFRFESYGRGPIVYPQAGNFVIARAERFPDLGSLVVPLQLGQEIGDLDYQPFGWIPTTYYDGGAIGSTMYNCSDQGCSGLLVYQDAYIGLQFQIDGQTHYGWGFFSWSRLMLTEYAYHTLPDMPILAGQVPEPGTVTLLLAGAGFLAWRFRRVRCST